MPEGRIIVCDWDGPVADTFEFTLRLLQTLCPWVTAEDYRRLFMGNIHSSTTLSPIKESMATFLEQYAAGVGVGHIAHALPHIALLAEKHTLHIITSNMVAGIDRVLESAGVRHFFGCILGMEVSHSKVEKFRMLAAQLGVDGSKFVFITDTLGDVAEAHKAGVGTIIAVTFGYHDRGTLSQGKPHTLVDSWPEVLAIL